jgi:hypothetical protein
MINESDLVSLATSYLNNVKCVIIVIESNNVKNSILNPLTQNNRIRLRLSGFFSGTVFLGELKKMNIICLKIRK